MRAEELADRFAERNTAALVLEADGKRRSRIIAFTRVDLMKAVLEDAAFRTAIACDIPSRDVRAALLPDPTTMKLVPAVEVADGVVVDKKKLSHVFTAAFRAVYGELAEDLVYAQADARNVERLAAALPPETMAAFCARLKAWA